MFASGRDVNILVMDTEVYSNTGGQASKSTPRGAVAKFAAGGKPGRKKDLGMIAMSYGNVFVGQISMGANPLHAIKTIRAAESYRGTSLLIAFSHCIGWGIDMTQRHEHPEGGGGLRLLAAVQLRSARRGAPVPPGQQEADGRLQGVRHEGGPLRHARPLEAARSRPGCWTWASRTSTTRWHFYEQLAGVTHGRRGERRDGGNGEQGQEHKGGGTHERRPEHEYLGLKLKNPLVIAACPLTRASSTGCSGWKRPARRRPCCPRCSRSRSSTTKWR